MPDRDLTNVQFPMLNSYPNRGRPHDRGTTRNPTSTSAENCALGIEHWSDPRSDVEQWILPSYFCASPKNEDMNKFSLFVVTAAAALALPALAAGQAAPTGNVANGKRLFEKQ